MHSQRQYPSADGDVLKPRSQYKMILLEDLKDWNSSIQSNSHTILQFSTRSSLPYEAPSPGLNPCLRLLCNTVVAVSIYGHGFRPMRGRVLIRGFGESYPSASTSIIDIDVRVA